MQHMARQLKRTERRITNPDVGRSYLPRATFLLACHVELRKPYFAVLVVALHRTEYLPRGKLDQAATTRKFRAARRASLSRPSAADHTAGSVANCL